MTAGRRSVAHQDEAVAEIDDATGKSPSRRLTATRCVPSVRSAPTSVVVYENSAPASDRKPRISSVPR
jgi:hypothetical protein